MRTTKVKLKSQRTDDGPTETRPRTKADLYPAPNEYAHLPEPVGTGQYSDNAKFLQKAMQYPGLKTTLQGHITVNEMQDQADDNTNFLGYANDN